YIFPRLLANAIYEGSYLLGTSIARPLIAKRQIEIAKRENTDAVAHGATGKGNDQVRFELTYLALNPSIKIIAPWREWSFRSRQDLMEYAKRRSPAALLAELNELGGAHGIGRVDVVENRYVGMKSRGVYETPGGTILHAAHRAVESLTLDREVLHLRDSLVPRYAEMVYYGY